MPGAGEKDHRTETDSQKQMESNRSRERLKKKPRGKTGWEEGKLVHTLKNQEATGVGRGGPVKHSREFYLFAEEETEREENLIPRQEGRRQRQDRGRYGKGAGQAGRSRISPLRKLRRKMF